MRSLQELQDLMVACVELGYIRGQVAMAPSSDIIRKKDAEEVLKRNGLNKVLLTRWVNDGLVTEYKGENNSPKKYSLTQIMSTIGAIKYKCFNQREEL